MLQKKKKKKRKNGYHPANEGQSHHIFSPPATTGARFFGEEVLQGGFTFNNEEKHAGNR